MHASASQSSRYIDFVPCLFLSLARPVSAACASCILNLQNNYRMSQVGEASEPPVPDLEAQIGVDGRNLHRSFSDPVLRRQRDWPRPPPVLGADPGAEPPLDGSLPRGMYVPLYLDSRKRSTIKLNLAKVRVFMNF